MQYYTHFSSTMRVMIHPFQPARQTDGCGVLANDIYYHLSIFKFLYALKSMLYHIFPTKKVYQIIIGLHFKQVYITLA